MSVVIAYEDIMSGIHVSPIVIYTFDGITLNWHSFHIERV